MAPPSSPELRLHHLRAIQVLGNGAMGTVFLVHNLVTDPNGTAPFALKVVEKSSPTTKPDADRRARWEIEVLERLTVNPHPFLPSLIGRSETGDFLGWGVPFCSGGDLNVLRHRQIDRTFSPTVIRFYVAEIVCALAHLHSMGIVYRDLKPENILIQGSGHVTLTDFDLSRTLSPKSLKSLIQTTETSDDTHHRLGFQNHRRKHKLADLFSFPAMVQGKKAQMRLKKAKSARVSPLTRKTTSFASGERSNSFVGTEEYVAPEVIRGDGHEFAVDWWALGILSYEMLYGTTPFRGKNRKDTFGRILIMPPNFTGKPTPLTDLITKLLAKEPTHRLGYAGGASEIQEHPFFNGLQWDLLTEVLRPPFIPSRDDVKSPTNPSINITEYFQKLREVPSPLESPSRDDCGYDVSLTEF